MCLMNHKNGVDVHRSCKSQCANHISLVEFINRKINLFNLILNLILQGFLLKFTLKSQISQKNIKKNCDEFGMICSIRWYDFHYLILLILENHIYGLTFWTKNETWQVRHKKILLIFKKSQYVILKTHTVQMIAN